jgi:large subunit ribosomal protein L30
MAEATVETQKEAPKKGSKLVVVRIRGAPKMKTVMEDTLKMLHLDRRHACAILEDTPQNRGMIKKVESYLTWGELDDATLKLLEEKKNLQSNDKAMWTGLSAPKQSLERKGIKMPFKRGGVLGYRGAEINALIQRMI